MRSTGLFDKHILECHELSEAVQIEEKPKFSDVFEDVTKQKKVVERYLIALKLRDSMLEDESQHSLPGLYTGPTLARTDRTGHGRGDIQPL